jgi:hypothetical protein
MDANVKKDVEQPYRAFRGCIVFYRILGNAEADVTVPPHP